MKYLLILFIICLCSCSTNRKIKSSSSIEERSNVASNTDSSSKTKIDSVSVKKDNAVTTIEKEDNYEKETTFEFLTPGELDSAARRSIATPIADYFPNISQPLWKITIKEKGVKKEKQTEQKNTYDSTSVKSEMVIVVTTTREVTYYKKAVLKNKDVKRTGFSIWVYVGAGVAILIYAAGIYFKLWPWHLGIIALFRKKKEQYPVTYNKNKRV